MRTSETMRSICCLFEGGERLLAADDEFHVPVVPMFVETRAQAVQQVAFVGRRTGCPSCIAPDGPPAYRKPQREFRARSHAAADRDVAAVLVDHDGMRDGETLPGAPAHLLPW